MDICCRHAKGLGRTAWMCKQLPGVLAVPIVDLEELNAGVSRTYILLPQPLDLENVTLKIRKLVQKFTR